MDPYISRLTIDRQYLDQYGHVNYKDITRLLEPIQDELLERCGTSFDLIELQMGLRSFVKKIEVAHHRELKEGESYGVLTRLGLGTTSMTFFQDIQIGGEQVVSLLLVVVLVDVQGRPAQIPMPLRKMLS